jgi:HEPN domain-containing protein
MEAMSTLPEMIARIIKLISVERIYLSRFEYEENSFNELTILIPNSSKIHVIEARPLANMVMADYTDHRFRLFYLHEVKQALKQGSIVFYRICKEENLIYQMVGSNFVLMVPDLTAKAALQRTKRNFAKELKKILGFREGAQFYLKQKNYSLAALMVHQVIELSYRTIELIVVGREKISHRIRNHQKFMQQYVPELATIFNSQDEKEMKLLDLLDDAYRAVRYENAYRINKTQLIYFIEKADLIGEELAKLYDVVVEQFKQDCLYL